MGVFLILAPVSGVLALLFAYYLILKVSRRDAGTDRMKEIAGFIGMNVATKANVRTAAAAKDHGMNALFVRLLKSKNSCIFVKTCENTAVFIILLQFL